MVPEQLTVREDLHLSISTIYRAVRQGLFTQNTKYLLRRKGKGLRRKGSFEDRRGHLHDCLSIDVRPVIIKSRERIGDWELDTLWGKVGHGGLVTAVDRRSRYLVAGKVEDKSSRSLRETLLRIMKGLICWSMTADNGKEFGQHKENSEKLKTPVYFAHPHSPWERGTNENTNGLIREDFSQGYGFSQGQ